MPFSRTLKASLVAMVLIILTAVPRLDAAPMENFQPWMQELHNIGKAKVPDLNEQAVGASFESAFQPVHPGEELQRGPQTPLPFGNQPWSTVGLPSWSSWNHPSGPTSSHPVSRPEPYHLQGTVGPSYGTAAVRSEAGQPSTSGGSCVTIALDAATREAKFGKTPVEEEPWSNDDILKILQGDQWKGLSPDNKAAFLNLFGDKVFTMDFYNRLPDLGEPNWKTGEGDLLTQTLVDEYFQLRMADLVGRPLQLDFSVPAGPSRPKSWRNLGSRFPPQQALQSDTFYSNSDHPFRPFRQGDFSIKLTSDKPGLTAVQVWTALENTDRYLPAIDVVARVDSRDRVYMGMARIKRAKLDNAKPT